MHADVSGGVGVFAASSPARLVRAPISTTNVPCDWWTIDLWGYVVDSGDSTGAREKQILATARRRARGFFLELRGRPGVWVLSPSLPADLAGGSAGASTFRVSLPLPKPRSAPTELTLESRRLLSVHVVIHRHSSTGMCFVPDDEADAFQGHPADNQGVTRGAWLMVLGLGKPYVCATGP